MVVVVVVTVIVVVVVKLNLTGRVFFRCCVIVYCFIVGCLKFLISCAEKNFFLLALVVDLEWLILFSSSRNK